MNKDFRIANTLPTHWKIKKLMRLLGDRAFFNLISLWAYVTEYRPKGDLSGMDIADIELAADWQGDSEMFVKTLIDLALLDTNADGCVFVHDWKEHNSYAFYGPERSLKASRAACARHRKQKASAKKAIEQENILLPARNNPAPSPSPSPSPKPKSKNPPTPSSQNQPKPKESFLKKVSQRVDLWNETTGQKLKPGTYLEAFKKRVAKDPDFFEKMDRAIPIAMEIDDSDWNNSVNLAWLMRPGRDGEIPVVDKVLDGAYMKRRRPGKVTELLEDFNARRAREQQALAEGGKHGSNVMEPGGQDTGGDRRNGADVFRYPDPGP